MFYQAYCRKERGGISRRAADESGVNKGEGAGAMLKYQLAIESRNQKRVSGSRKYKSLLKIEMQT